MFSAKRIADPVHGTIGLSDLEARVISTRAFQRLRSVKQLGLHIMFSQELIILVFHTQWASVM